MTRKEIKVQKAPQDKVVSLRATVVEYGNGFYTVRDDEDSQKTFFLVGWQMGGGKVGDKGVVVYRVGPRSGLDFFIPRTAEGEK